MGNWIDVNQQLPKHTKTVMVKYRYQGVSGEFPAVILKDKKQWHIHVHHEWRFRPLEAVTHWKPSSTS